MLFNGYSYDEIRKLLADNDQKINYGEEIKPHTQKKIEFVKRYVEEWLYVISNVSNYIYFMDIMSNAGLYKNGYLSTSINVLNIFTRYAIKYPNKEFFILTNDYDQDKVKTMNCIFNIYRKKFKEININNIFLEIDCKDATDYLNTIPEKHSRMCLNSTQKSILLYVDPYKFLCTTLAEAVKKFTNEIYCELLINFYSNDYVRNINNAKNKKYQEEIKDFLSSFCSMNTAICNKTDIVRDRFINVFIEQTKIRYYYYISMNNKKDSLLYYLIFLTPNIKGLEKVKEATWKVIGYHDKYSVSNHNEEEMYEKDVFGKTPEEKAMESALLKIKNILIEKNYMELDFNGLVKICLQNTFMKESHIINNVIKPLIEEGFLEKAGLVNKNNYKQDLYIIK